MTEIAVELIRILPSLMWFIFVIFVLLLFYQPIRDQLLPNLKVFKAMGVELNFVRESLDSAAAAIQAQEQRQFSLARKSERYPVDISARDKERAVKRISLHVSLFRNRRILWVDDVHENNINEREMFIRLNCQIDQVTDTEKAIREASRRKYDIIFSDMVRYGDAQAGLKLLDRLKEMKLDTPLVFYIGNYNPEDGIPPGAFGLTNRPDELVHLFLDAVERKL